MPSEAAASSSGNSLWRGALGLFERSNPHKGIARFGLPLLQTLKHYIVSDPFTTLLDAPASRFVAIFFSMYMTTYFLFACVYMIFPSSCINEPTRNFGHVFWFSFQTASTIGYSTGMYPDPDCNLINFIAMLQIILASLMDYCLMGVVFARFAAPMPKSRAIRFSSYAVLYQPDPQAYWQLCFRMASIRKHSLLKPEVSLLLAMPEGNHDPSNAALRFLTMEVEDVTSQVANLRLGLPIIVKHCITPHSPLWDLSLDGMDLQGLEIICFMDGMDPMTSNSVQARHSYRPSDIRMNEVFSAIGLQANWRGQMGLDFTQFDVTMPLYPTQDDSSHISELVYTSSGRLVGTSFEPGPSAHHSHDQQQANGNPLLGDSRHMRSQTFCILSAGLPLEHAHGAAYPQAKGKAMAGARGSQGEGGHAWGAGKAGGQASPFEGPDGAPAAFHALGPGGSYGHVHGGGQVHGGGAGGAWDPLGAQPLPAAAWQAQGPGPGAGGNSWSAGGDGGVAQAQAEVEALDREVSALIEAVLGDAGAGSELRAAAALARAEQLTSTLRASTATAQQHWTHQQQQQQQQQQQGQQLWVQGQGQAQGQLLSEVDPWLQLQQPALPVSTLATAGAPALRPVAPTGGATLGNGPPAFTLE